MAEAQRWPGFGYVQVPGLANRLISRWLRTQRKNMRRFFVERGLIDLADRMDRIRKSNKGMMEKNRAFQKVLDDYAKLANPAGATPVAAVEASDQQVPGDTAVAVQPAGLVAADSSGSREDDGAGVQELASDDGVGLVVEE
jgi:hypothetical protein